VEITKKVNVCVVASVSESDLKDKIRRNIRRLISSANNISLFREVAYRYFFKNSIDFYSLNEAIYNADILVIVYLEDSSMVLSCIGIAASRDTPIFVFGEKNNNVFSDIKIPELHFLPCINILDYQNYKPSVSLINETLNKVWTQYSYRERMFYDFWFPLNTKEITIVASPEAVKPYDADLLSHNYGFMDNVGDKDAILEIVKLISRYYPETNITITETTDFPATSLTNNLIVIGGPGGSDYIARDGSKIDDEGNKICKLLSQKIQSKISYSSDCETMKYGAMEYHAEYDDCGLMITDYGYFSAVQNPFNPQNRAIMIHGIHTLGVVGAAKAFSSEIIAEKNYQLLYEKNIETKTKVIEFESFFQVDVYKGQAFCPSINAKDILMLAEPQFCNGKKKDPYSKKLFTVSHTDFETSRFRVNSLWEEITKELPAYKDDAPCDYNTFTQIAHHLKDLLIKIDNKEINIDEANELFETYNNKWRRRNR
jgi:hypothetical protein